MGTAIVGIILIVIGLIALLAGVGGGIAKMYLETKKELARGGAGAITLPTEMMKALTEFLKALAAAPMWLALVIIGILLVAWGGTML